MTRESPMLISAWWTLPPGSAKRKTSSAPERFLVEGNGVAGAAQNQIRGHSVMTLGDRFHCSGHIGLPLAVVLGALLSMAFP